MARNPLKWPSFEQLPRDFYEQLQPAMQQIDAGAVELDDEVLQCVERLQTWLDAPCVATVKLDGTNVGIDDAGIAVGRNNVIELGENYQKVDVWPLLADGPRQAAQLRGELAAEAGEAVAQVMLYGELLVNGKYDYKDSGIIKGWLFFGAVLRPEASDDEAARRLSQALRASGFSARAADDAVVLSTNSKLEARIAELGVCSVAEGYRPRGLTEAQWAEHDGAGRLPVFNSLRQLIVSDWAGRFLLPASGSPLGEGLVVASAADGRLFKFKHGGEDLGKVPQQLLEVVTALRALASSERAGLLPADLLPVFERLLLVAESKPEVKQAAPKPKQEKVEDDEALAAWASALTKFNSLEEVFAKGRDAQVAREKDLIEEITSDLVKDYGASDKDARQRATKLVKIEVGKSFGAWKKSRS